MTALPSVAIREVVLAPAKNKPVVYFGTGPLLGALAHILLCGTLAYVLQGDIRAPTFSS